MTLGELYTAGELLVLSALSGDYNNDGVVDAADYNVWRDNLDAPAGTLLNDTAGGVIGSAQYDAWAANFGATLSPPPAAVPEASSVVILASLVGICFFGRPASTCRSCIDFADFGQRPTRRGRNDRGGFGVSGLRRLERAP